MATKKKPAAEICDHWQDGDWQLFGFKRTSASDERFTVQVNMKTGVMKANGELTLFETETAIGHIRAHIGSELQQIKLRLDNQKGKQT